MATMISSLYPLMEGKARLLACLWCMRSHTQVDCHRCAPFNALTLTSPAEEWLLSTLVVSVLLPLSTKSPMEKYSQHESRNHFNLEREEPTSSKKFNLSGSRWSTLNWKMMCGTCTFEGVSDGLCVHVHVHDWEMVVCGTCTRMYIWGSQWWFVCVHGHAQYVYMYMCLTLQGKDISYGFCPYRWNPFINS